MKTNSLFHYKKQQQQETLEIKEQKQQKFGETENWSINWIPRLSRQVIS